jgi:hypothetical protein
MGQTRRSTENTFKKDGRHLRLFQSESPVVTEFSIQRGHRIQFQDTETLSEVSSNIDPLVKEEIDIPLHPNNINKEEGLKL